MAVNPISMLMPQGSAIAVTKVGEVDPNNFSNILSDALKQVNETQVQADESTQKLVLGEVDDIHQVMLDMEQAKLSLQLTVQVRNKLVEAYQEISRMQF